MKTQKLVSLTYLEQVMLAAPKGSRFTVIIGERTVTTDSLAYAQAEAKRNKTQVIISL